MTKEAHVIFDALSVNGVLERKIIEDFHLALSTEDVSAPDKDMDRAEWSTFCNAAEGVVGKRKFEDVANQFVTHSRPLNDLCLNLGQVTPQIVSSTEFMMPSRFVIKETVGMGQYGIVCSATEGDEPVAVKRIENVFESMLTAERTLRELKLLRLLQGHDNVINMKCAFVADPLGTFNEVYLVSELIQQDLSAILNRRDIKDIMSEDHMQFLLYQILRGMKYVHSAKVIHRDLKPRNLLVSHNWDLVICDFGLARRQLDEPVKDESLTCYICSRWYRAPEALCCLPSYTVKLDMWGIGCIWAEILAYGSVLFQGKDTLDVLRHIGKSLGAPSQAWQEKVPSEKCRQFLKTLPDASSVAGSLRGIFDSKLPDLAIKLVEDLCKWDPAERISCEECLALPYFHSIACPEDEPTYNGPNLSNAKDFDFEKYLLTDHHLRTEIFLEVLLYHPEEREQFLSRSPLGLYDVTKLERKSSKQPAKVIQTKSVTSHLMSGMVWKLNSDGNPGVTEHWLERKMWLTKNGGLFYYSKKHDAPIGRSVRELHAHIVEDSDKYARPFVFQLTPTTPGGATTTLGSTSEEERQAWIQHLSSFEEETPMFRMDLYKPQTEKRKRNIFTAATQTHENKSPMGKLRVQRTRTRELSMESEPIVAKGRRRNSQLLFTSPDQTIVVFDWDDTLFPTTWIREDMKLNWRTGLDWQMDDCPLRTEIARKLNNLSDHVLKLLRATKKAANVVIVTLAKAPWVEISSKNFMPELWKALGEMNISVVYAQAAADPQKQTAYNKAEFKSANEVEKYWTGVKAEAISQEVQRVYSKYPGQSWKNIISMGDSNFERQATQGAVRRYWANQLGVPVQWEDESLTMEGVMDDHYKKVRVKTFKLLDEPTVEELLAQVQLMQIWMSSFINYDSGIDVVLEDSSEDAAIHSIHRTLTNCEPPETLCWTVLGGLC